MSMSEDKIIKTVIYCYVAISIIASAFFFFSRNHFRELEFTQENLSFDLARGGVRFYTVNNHTQFWLDCGYLGQEQTISLCDLPDKSDYRATISGHYLEYMSWIIPDKSVPHTISLSNLETGKVAYHFTWSNKAIKSQTQDIILWFCLFYAFLVIPVVLTVIPFSIRLIFT